MRLILKINSLEADGVRKLFGCVVGFGNRIAHVLHEFKKINRAVDLIAYVDPQPIGKNYAVKIIFFLKNLINH